MGICLFRYFLVALIGIDQDYVGAQAVDYAEFFFWSSNLLFEADFYIDIELNDLF